MIRQADIKNLVAEWGLRHSVIEKDYVIGWLLWGLGSEADLQDTWVFKGGTCLKKCYFETYRFSEDLDFTVLPNGLIDPEEVLPVLERVLARVHAESGIDLRVRDPRMKRRPRGRSSEARVYYRGPNMAPMPASVKLDLNAGEKVVSPTVPRPISHPYPDAFPDDGVVQCYSFVELFAEKIRALGERCRPRDLYDVVNLYWRADLQSSAAEVRKALVEKCDAKNLPLPTLEGIEDSPRLAELEGEWANMLAHQLPDLPPHSLYWAELRSFFEWLEGRRSEVVLPAVRPRKDEDPSWRPPGTVHAWGRGIPLEIVRFAGINRLCVEIDYADAHGKRTTRLIEPYSLRRTLDGNIVLHAVDVGNRAERSFRVDRIHALLVTTTPFEPKYEVEFVKHGPLSVGSA